MNINVSSTAVTLTSVEGLGKQKIILEQARNELAKESSLEFTLPDLNSSNQMEMRVVGKPLDQAKIETVTRVVKGYFKSDQINYFKCLLARELALRNTHRLSLSRGVRPGI